MATALVLASAVLARLRALPNLTVLDGKVATTPPGAYVVLYDTTPRLSSGRLVGTSDRMVWGFQLVCAGRDPNEVRHVVQQALTTLANWRPVADRGTTWLVPQPDDAPVLPDESVPGDTRFSQTLTFRLTTRSTS